MSFQTLPETAERDVPAIITQAFATLYSDDFANAMMGINHSLTTEVRGWHEKADWGMGVLLTPWMLTKVYVPLKTAVLDDIATPESWTTDERLNQPYVVIGDLMPLTIDEQTHQTYINHHPDIGHYWLQPLVQNMARYSDNDAAFAAWGEVLAFRKAYRDQKAADEAVKAQQALKSQASVQNDIEVNRRAFLAKWIK